MKDCYRRNYNKYDCLIFYDLDEFIHLSNYSNIKIFLNEEKFNKCNLVYLNLLCHTDNNLIELMVVTTIKNIKIVMVSDIYISIDIDLLQKMIINIIILIITIVNQLKNLLIK